MFRYAKNVKQASFLSLSGSLWLSVTPRSVTQEHFQPSQGNLICRYLSNEDTLVEG